MFRSYGRIGTIIGGNQCDQQPSKQDAIDLFCTMFTDKTGNVWGSKFVRKPGRYISLDIDYGQVNMLLNSKLTNMFYHKLFVAHAYRDLLIFRTTLSRNRWYQVQRVHGFHFQSKL